MIDGRVMQTRANTQLRQKVGWIFKNVHLFSRQKTSFPSTWDNIYIQFRTAYNILAASHRPIQRFSKHHNQSNCSSLWTMLTNFPQNRLVAPEKNSRKTVEVYWKFHCKSQPHWVKLAKANWNSCLNNRTKFAFKLFQFNVPVVVAMQNSNVWLELSMKFSLWSFKSNRKARFPLVFHYVLHIWLLSSNVHGLKSFVHVQCILEWK